MSAREAEIAAFLAAGAWRHAARRPLAGDASFRRYFRLAGGPAPALLMDAPPPREDVRPFVKVARHLAALGLSAPAIHAVDAEHGFVVLEDFGDATFPAAMAAGDPAAFYVLATDTLIALHRTPAMLDIEVPAYDAARLTDMAALLLDWFLPAASGAPVAAAARADYRAAWAAVLPLREAVPTVLALRDYFPENLMWLAGREGVRRCGLLDFQDAMAAPAVYDLVSLVEDARRDVPDALRAAMLARYLAAFPAIDPAGFAAACAVMAAQRHARVIGVFVRLWQRDGKPGYLRHLPRLWRLLDRALAHPALAPLRRWFDAEVPPAWRVASLQPKASPP